VDRLVADWDGDVRTQLRALQRQLDRIDERIAG
jgi:hypothetical protein